MDDFGEFYNMYALMIWRVLWYVCMDDLESFI